MQLQNLINKFHFTVSMTNSTNVAESFFTFFCPIDKPKDTLAEKLAKNFFFSSAKEKKLTNFKT